MRVINYLKETAAMVIDIDSESVDKLLDLIKEAKDRGGNVYVFGNGGSGANASHFAQDLMKCPVKDFNSNTNRYRIICLNDNAPVIMAYANDISYEEVFVQQLMNFCKQDDLVIGISGSGNSMNVVKAMSFAKNIGAKTFGIVGFDGGKLLRVVDHAIHIKKNNMQIFEDGSSVVLHSVVAFLSE